MKKYFFLALAAIVSLVFASCSEDLSSFAQREGEVDVTYTVSTQSAPGTRASHDGDGMAANVNRYICEVWNVESDGALSLYKRIENVVASGTTETTFGLRLVSQQSYKVLFWADHAEVVGTGEVDGNNIIATDIYYDTTKGLQEVTLNKDEGGHYIGNNDEMDAFFGCETIENLNGTINKTGDADENHVVLKRPFAQLNVITTDIDDIRKNAVTSTMNPNKIKMTVKAPTKFNVLNGEATAEEDIEYTAAVYYNISGVNKTDATGYTNSYAYCTLAMNYYFAPADEKAVETVNMVALNGNKELISPVFANIPLQRNYRTNIIGDLFTDAVNYKVEIKPNWDGEKDVNITRVENIAAANTALATGETDLEITTPNDASTNQIVFTTANNDKNITLNFTGDVSGNTITIKNDAATTTGPASVNVTAPSGTNLVFENETHVVLNGHDYGTVSGSFSANTLVISEGVTVQTLAPSKGKIEIHGTVNNLNLEGSTAVFGKSENISEAMKAQIGNKLAENFIWKQNAAGTWDIVSSDFYKVSETEYHIKSADGMVEFASKVNGGTTFAGKTIILDSDIDLNGVNWTPIGNVTSYPSISFHGTFDGQNHTIKNLTTSDNLQNYASAGLFGSICGTIKNLTVENATVTSTHYAGVICGFSSANTATVIENCHVKNATVTSTPETIGEEYDNGDKVGGIIGYIVSGDKVTGCSVENITVKAYRDLGAVVGCAISGAATGVTNNSAKDCNVIQCNKNGYKNEAITTYGAIIGRHDNDVPESNTATNVTLQSDNE